MSYNIGLNIVEVNGAGAPAIAGAATSVAGFNIVTQRGIENSPARITSFADYVERFGGHFSGGLGSYLVRGFFENGGAIAYVNRVVGAASTVASLQLLNSSKPILCLEGGYRGSRDLGSWGLQLYAQAEPRSVVTGLRLEETARARITTTDALPEFIDMAGASYPPLAITIDGSSSQTVIKFIANDFQPDPSKATRQQIINAINRSTSNIEATLSESNQLVLTSTANIALLSGGFTSLSLKKNKTLGFPSDVVGTAVISDLDDGGAILHDVTGLKPGDALEMKDKAKKTAQVKIQSVNTMSRSITWTPKLSNRTPTDYDLTSLRFSSLEFDLKIFEGGPSTENLVETFNGLSMESDVQNYFVNVINDPLVGSTHIRAVDLIGSDSTSTVKDRPDNLSSPVKFNTGGIDADPTASDFSGDMAARTGFYAFSPFDIQILTCELTELSIASAGIAYCESREDCMYVGAVPRVSISSGTAVDYGKALQGQKRYGALYGPWVMVSDPIGGGDNPMKFVPPTGHVMGVYARIERTRGIWKAPAGDEAQLRGVIDVSTRFSDVEHTDLVKNGSVNGIRALPRVGVVIDSSRTLSTDSRWLYVNVRLLFNFVKSSLREGLRWVRQEPNKDQLWNLVKYESVTPFLTRLWSQGAFGTGQPSDVFKVICDASNNPPSQVQLGFLYVEIYFYPSVPAETIIVKVGQQPGGANASES